MQKAKVYVDVNVLIHAAEGTAVPNPDARNVEVHKALTNLFRGYAGCHVQVCTSHWEVSVLKKKLKELNMSDAVMDSISFLIDGVDHTGGLEDTVVVTEEDYRNLDKEAKVSNEAPDGEDLGHLKAMKRLGVDVFITDDGEFAECMARGFSGIEVVKESEFIKLALRGRFFVESRKSLAA
jgi:predicted nucleic acid-binding protein